jgi:hypothetical protein
VRVAACVPGGNAIGSGPPSLAIPISDRAASSSRSGRRHAARADGRAGLVSPVLGPDPDLVCPAALVCRRTGATRPAPGGRSPPAWPAASSPARSRPQHDRARARAQAQRRRNRLMIPIMARINLRGARHPTRRLRFMAARYQRARSGTPCSSPQVSAPPS